MPARVPAHGSSRRLRALHPDMPRSVANGDTQLVTCPAPPVRVATTETFDSGRFWIVMELEVVQEPTRAAERTASSLDLQLYPRIHRIA